jgi:hypothetical protein
MATGGAGGGGGGEEGREANNGEEEEEKSKRTNERNKAQNQHAHTVGAMKQYNKNVKHGNIVGGSTLYFNIFLIGKR